MPTTYGTKTKKKDIRKKAENLDLDRLKDLANTTNDDGSSLSHQEIADRMGCSRPAVTRALQRIPQWQLQERDIEQFKLDRADIFAQAQQMILQYITVDKLKVASLQQLGTLFGIMYDKERLERGQATQHIAEVSQLKLDKETLKLINMAIESRTKSIVYNAHEQNPAEIDISLGDSNASKVSKQNEELN